MEELHLTIEALLNEVQRGKSLMLVEPIHDSKWNILIGTEKVLTVKDIEKVKDRYPEQMRKVVRVRTTIPHFIEEDKRVKWAAYSISIFEGKDLFKGLPREKKEFVIKYLKNILSDSDYLVWKISQLKSFSQKVFEHSLCTCFIALVTYSTYSIQKLSGMLDARIIEEITLTTLLHGLGLTQIFRTQPDRLEKKRIEYALNRTSDFYQYTIEGYKILKSESNKHEIPEAVLDAILNCEEFIDGSGGPRGIQESDLSFLTRIISLANYFELTISGEWSIKERSYRECIGKMRLEKEKFDAGLFEALDSSFKYLFQMSN